MNASAGRPLSSNKQADNLIRNSLARSKVRPIANKELKDKSGAMAPHHITKDSQPENPDWTSAKTKNHPKSLSAGTDSLTLCTHSKNTTARVLSIALAERPSTLTKFEYRGQREVVPSQ
jgi:hypothetical protein